MREILFRGKRIGNSEWVYGYYVPVCFGRFPCKPAIVPESDGTWEPTEVKKETVGQYIGLTDKNGTRVFEGDCFKTYCAGLPVYKHIVGYYPEHFAFMARCIEMNTVHYLSDYRSSAIEVIGNIHDNPELLEEKE